MRQILAFSGAGFGLTDRLRLLLAGYARVRNFGPSALTTRIGKSLFPMMRVRPRLFGGLKLVMDPFDVTQLVVAEEILVEHVYDLSVVDFPPDVVLDCGAHIGMFTLLAASRFPNAKLVCFEPDPANLAWLGKQFEANKLSVTVVDAAVSTENGSAEFEAGQGSGSGLRPNPGGTLVRTVDLAEYIASLECRRLLLKMDVEGAEEAVLPKVLPQLPEQCAIFMETHGGMESWSRLSGLAQQHGFSVSMTRQRELYTDGIAIRSAATRIP